MNSNPSRQDNQPKAIVANQDTVNTLYQTKPVGAGHNGTGLRILFVGSSLLAPSEERGLAGQGQLVPQLLESQGSPVYAAMHHGPGMCLVKAHYFNKGELDPCTIETMKNWGGSVGQDDPKFAAYKKLHDTLLPQMKCRMDSIMAAEPWEIIVLDGTPSPHRYNPEDQSTQIYMDEYDQALTRFKEKALAANPNVRILVPIFFHHGKAGVSHETLAAFREYQLEATENAKKRGLEPVPVAAAYLRAHFENPSWKIYVSAEDRHPGLHGRYLAACMIYAAITGESPIGLPSELSVPNFQNGQPLHILIDSDDAQQLQQIAWDEWRGKTS